MKMSLKHRIKKALAVSLILAFTFSINLNALAEEKSPDNQNQVTELSATDPSATDNGSAAEVPAQEVPDSNAPAGNDAPVQVTLEGAPVLEAVTGTAAITFDLAGGTSAAGETGSFAGHFWPGTNKIIKPDDPTLADNTFKGWFDPAGFSFWDFDNSEVSTSASSITLVAIWEPNPAPEEYTITFKLNGGISASGATDSFSGSVWTGTKKIIQPTDPTRKGYTFDGWYHLDTGSGQIKKWDFGNDEVNSSVTTLEAGWIEDPAAGISVYASNIYTDKNGTELPQNGQFGFSLTYIPEMSNLTNAPADMSANNASDGSITFDMNGVDFTEAGGLPLAVFELTEKNGSDINIQYNIFGNVYYVTIGENNTHTGMEIEYFADRSLSQRVSDSEVKFFNIGILNVPGSAAVNAINVYTDKSGTKLTQNGQFDFTLSYIPEMSNLANAPTDIKANNASDGSISFDMSGTDFSNTSAGLPMAVFEMTEQTGTDTNIQYNIFSNVYYVTIGENNTQTGLEVEYFADKGLSQRVSDAEVKFFNLGKSSTPVSLKVNASKIYTDQNGAALEQNGQFSFTLKYIPEMSNLVTSPADMNAGNASDGSVSFDMSGVDFTNTGSGVPMAVFVLTEQKGLDADIQYNVKNNTYYVVIGENNTQTGLAIEYFADKELRQQVNDADVKFYNVRVSNASGSTSASSGSGSSEYVPISKYPAVIDPPVQKLLGGDTPDTSATFTFALKADNPKFPMPSGSSDGIKMMTITGAGSGEFGNIAYYQPGTFTYTCYEVNNGLAGYTYDASVYTMKVVVADAGDRLRATRTIIRSDGNAADKFAFGNWYTKTAVTPVAVNNTPAPTNPDVPKTADSFPLYLFILMFAAGSAGIILVSVEIYKSSHKTD